MNTRRSVIEIFGYTFSGQGMRQFLEDRPNAGPQIAEMIRKDIEETGRFPRDPRFESETLERRPDGVIILHTSAEISMCETIPAEIPHESLDLAIRSVLRCAKAPTYLVADREEIGDGEDSKSQGREDAPA